MSAAYTVEPRLSGLGGTRVNSYQFSSVSLTPIAEYGNQQSRSVDLYKPNRKQGWVGWEKQQKRDRVEG